MSRNATIKTIRKELDKVNDVIDMKIIKGLPYAKEAQRHKFLLSCLTHAQRDEQIRNSMSFINKLSHAMTSFIL